ncbi:unnamed protein product [Prorocentrum cordatum]|uniref:PDZ domain-containing protein n=1 Tax=Prorocentrum cordatum TaxID=2364126 RepID=A0ABN9X9P3_9DINO|nr:unnamed protein product [Polarella glacialis]
MPPPAVTTDQVAARGLQDFPHKVFCCPSFRPTPPLQESCSLARRGRGTSLAATVQKLPATEYVMTVDKTGGGKMGLRLEGPDDASELLVTNVAEGLLCQRWGLQNPDRAVLAGDVLLEVNGVQGSATLMKEELRKDGLVSMRLRRGPGHVWSDHAMRRSAFD